jgi:transposase
MQVYGIDLSMEKFDVNYLTSDGNEKKLIVKNAIKPIEKFLINLPANAILCAEYTGVYGDLLVYLCNQLDIAISLVPGYNIRHSLGLVKGKTDTADARNIREYGERFFDKLVYKTYDHEDVVELKELHTLRAQLVKLKKSLLTNESGRKNLPMQCISVHSHLEQVLLKIEQEIEDIEEEIITIIATNSSMTENYKLITSIKGIGPVIGTDLIIKTGNFKTIDSARKAASYAGICPFPNSSGKMVGKAKTSPFGDKKLKSLFYMGVKAAVKHNKEYKLYYQKKELEGKPYFLIMNNIANKMLRTVYSVIKSKVPYNENHICNDPREKYITSSKKNVA